MTTAMLMRGTPSTRASSSRTSSTASRRASTSMPGARASTPQHRDHAREPARGARRSWPRCCASRPSIPRSSSSCAPSGSPGIEQQRSDPSALAFTAVPAAPQPLSQGRHPLRRDRSTRASRRVKAVTREQVVQFHRDFFGAQPAQFAAVGDFDAAAIAKQVAKLFGELEDREAVQARRQRVLRRQAAREPRSRRPTRRRPSSSPA